MLDSHAEWILHARRSDPIHKVKIRNGQVLFQRFGFLNPVHQGKWKSKGRAPARKGIWAFPWPSGDIWYFGWHKWDEVLPKHLRKNAEDDLIRGQEWWDERDRWIKTKGRQVMWIKKFYYGGEVFTHLDQDGKSVGWGCWNRMPVLEYVKAAKKREPGYGTDELEVFIPRR